MKTVALYPGTFDPITQGHSDLARRAAKMFDRIIIAVAQHTGKTPMFSLEERVSLANEVFADTDNIEVMSFDGLLVEFARKQQAGILIRGLRAISDFEYEFQLAGMNRRLAPEVETIFLSPADQYAYVSSSFVREIATLGGDVSEFVHPQVMAALQQRMR